MIADPQRSWDAEGNDADTFSQGESAGLCRSHHRGHSGREQILWCSASRPRHTAGKDDYEAVDAVVERLMLRRVFELTDGVRDAYIQLWEARAVALMSQPHVWNAVESLVYDLQMSEGSMGRTDLTASIKRGLHPKFGDPGESL
jgi:hypothetical protein